MTLKHLSKFGIFLGALAMAGCSEAPTQDSAEAAEDAAPADPLFYQITNRDGEIEGWMLGTIHALPDGVRWRTPKIKDAMAKADLAVVEVANLDKGDAIASVFTELSRTPGMPALSARVGPDFRDDLSELLKASDYETQDFGGIETWAAALMLARTHATGKSINGVDLAIIWEFRSRKLVELEGAAGQLSIFDTLPEADQRDLLEGVIIESAQAAKNPGKLRDAWIAGDEAALTAATSTGIMADPELREALVTRRNKDWTAKIVPMLEEAPLPLIAVGAGHLVGADSLPAMLERRGYTVTRLSR